MRSLAVNAVLYQVGWFACVLGAAHGWGTAGALLATALSMLHLALAEHPGREWPLMAVALVIGAWVDTLHGAFGVLDFPNHRPGTLAPLWLLALWLQFATTLNFSMRWLSRNFLLAGALGLIGGPLVFLTGERLGAATLGEPRWLSIAVLGVVWALALPGLAALARRLGGAGRYPLIEARAQRSSTGPGPLR